MATFTTIFTFFLVFTAVFATPVKRTVAQVEADIATISSQVTSLNNNIQSFPNSGGSLVNALVGVLYSPVFRTRRNHSLFKKAIHNAAVALESSITKGTTDVQVIV
jgi:hypothetical protein